MSDASATYQPEKRTIGELLATTSPSIVVPDWQRSYSWTLSQIETFWSDIVDFIATKRNEYFLGSVVIIRTSDGRHLLLDGQQRIATSTILLSVIRDFQRRFKPDAAARTQTNYLTNYDDATEEVKYKLTLNRYDAEFFRQHILEEREDKKPPTAEKPSHDLILRAKRYFVNKFEEAHASLSPEEAFKWTLSIQGALTRQFNLIAIISTHEDSAADVFETLNDRGIGLSTPDLLRNLIMRRARPKSHDRLVSLWDEILEFDSDQTIKSFIRHHWISKYGDVKSQSLYREMKRHIESKEIDSVTFSIELTEAANIYRNILSGLSDKSETEGLLKDISVFGAGSRILYPSLMTILDIVPPDKQSRTIRVLINTYVRHTLIGGRENSLLENILYRATRSFREHRDLARFEKEVDAGSLTDSEFMATFSNAELSGPNQQRYVLRMLERAKRTTPELQVSSPTKVHVEHIYPQRPPEGSRWPDHDKWVNRIGNLTLLSARLNSSIGNSKFETKCGAYRESEILITQALGEYSDWSADNIKARQLDLASIAVIAWPRLPPSEA